uniref:Reverse transcriptase domain-containing protein n=1 Tax=Nicotiana tabacum TaxID=4097 RepID=A0A1S4BEZ5_TOBAC|nr:PREDICTED: uncharacterized protein LOC107807533 [Nicotiana tabacum]
MAIFEPFISNDKLEGYRKFLGFQHCCCNNIGQIWCFWNSYNTTTVTAISDQHITINFHNAIGMKDIYITAVYAKCKSKDRRDLWQSLELDNMVIDVLWCVGGDFNIIMDPNEKLWGKPHRMYKSLEFQTCINKYGLIVIGYNGSNYTWCNNRRPGKRIWKKLDRNFVNDHWDQLFQRTSELEDIDIEDNSEKSREDVNRAHAQYIRWLNLQESMLKQKSQIKWFEEGENNTRYFHSILREKRRRQQINRIKNSRGNWIKGDEKIARKAVRHFQTIFNLTPPIINNSILDCIPFCISGDDNIMLSKVPEEDEIKEAVFSLSPHSTAGPDGFNGTFVQSCWKIIEREFIAFVKDLFRGKGLTKFYSHTCLVLIPKIDNHATFSDFRPINLSNFTNKIISKIISLRVNTLLHKIVSLNQSDFVKDRLISENVLLAQEIVHNIFHCNHGGNVFIKLDMAKAYDRMDWDFLYAVLRKFDFFDNWIGLVHNLISNVWYSVIINGMRHGFFSSSQGLKQGDPLSPTLFIIAAEVLPRSLNSLYRNPNFTPFSMPPNIPRINHLAYADDIVIFYSGDSTSIKLVMNVIDNYERSSGQLVNRDKSYFLTAPNTATTRIYRIRKYSDFMDKNFPFTYLGCPLYVGRKKIDFFDNIISKIVKRLNGWQGKMLSHGGVFRLIEKHFANFFWGSSEDHKKYYWSSWNYLAPPLDEGGIGIRKMEDISNMLAMKKWWRIRSTSSIWATFIRNKYCVRSHLVSKMLAPGPLAKQFPDTPKNSKSLVRKFISDGQWNTNKLKELLPDHLVQQIQIIPIGNQNKEDQSFWALSDNGKFGDQKRFNKYRLKQQIAWSIETAVNKAYPNYGLKLPWNSFYDTLTRLRPGYKSMVVRWYKPEREWVKINTNESFLQGEGKVGLGGVIRDEYGDIIMAFSISVIAKNHNIAEAQAALVGLNWCKQNGFNQAILELDSLNIVEILRKDSDTNYKLSHIVNKIKETISMLNIQSNHCYREANQLPDSLAKRAVETQQPSHFYSSHQLSRQAKGLFLLDKDQIPCIRNKYDKANFFVS